MATLLLACPARAEVDTAPDAPDEVLQPSPRRLVQMSAIPSVLGLFPAPLAFTWQGLPTGASISLGLAVFSPLITAPSIGHYMLGDYSTGLGFTGLRLLASFFLISNLHGLYYEAIPNEFAFSTITAVNLFALFSLSIMDIAIADAKAHERAKAGAGPGDGEAAPRDPPIAWSLFGTGGMTLFIDQRDPPDGRALPFGSGGAAMALAVYPKRPFHGGLRLDLMWGVAPGHWSCPDGCRTGIGHPVPGTSADDREDPTEVALMTALLLVDLRWRAGRYVTLGPRFGGAFDSRHGPLLPCGLAAGLGADVALVRGKHGELVAEVGAVYSDPLWGESGRFLFLHGGLGFRLNP